MAASQTNKAARTRGVDVDLHKALSHTLRVEILHYLAERGTASPVEMSRLLGAPVGDISHHVKQLVKYGCAEQVKTRPRRGAVEHFYRSTSRAVVSADDLNRMPMAARHAFSGQVVRAVLGDLEQAFEAGTIDNRTDWILTRIPMLLDAQGWDEMQALHKRTFDETYEVQARSDERRATSGEEPVGFSSCQLCFEMPPNTEAE